MAELRCSDGTVVQISAETEAELRKAFGPKPESTYRVGDIFWRNYGDGGSYLQIQIEGKGASGRVYLRCTSQIRGSVGGCRPVKDVNAITMDEVRQLTCFPDGLRFVEVFIVSEPTLSL